MLGRAIHNNHRLDRSYWMCTAVWCGSHRRATSDIQQNTTRSVRDVCRTYAVVWSCRGAWTSYTLQKRNGIAARKRTLEPLPSSDFERPTKRSSAQPQKTQLSSQFAYQATHFALTVCTWRTSSMAMKLISLTQKNCIRLEKGPSRNGYCVARLHAVAV